LFKKEINMLKIKKGDKVKVRSGKDKGREGKVEKLFPKKMTALIPEINMFKKHVKGSQGQKGGIFDIPRPLSLNKLSLICPKWITPTRVGFKMANGRKTRVCKKCGKNIDTSKN